ncbi:MAG: hypothetical protein Roseis2KO_08230 [Roseivirga sp.]
MIRKKLRLGFSSIAYVMLIIGIILSGCKKENPDPQAQRLNELLGTWTVSQVENDNTDVTGLYAGFELTINQNKTFQTVNGGNPWPATGTFDFLNADSIDQILRNDDTIISLSNITASTLTLQFSSNNTGGRAAGITGVFTFTLIK